ncbi:MAG: hypothetical protein ABII00_06435 [Elusimicrobiota bacterium]
MADDTPEKNSEEYFQPPCSPVDRRSKRRADPSAPQGDQQAAPGPTPPQAGEAAGAPPNASEARQRLRSAFGEAKVSPGKPRKQPAPSPGPGNLPQWNMKHFTRTPDQAKRDLDPRNQMTRLFDMARNRPFLSAGILLLALSIFVADMVKLVRRYNISQWLPISYILRPERKGEFRLWEQRSEGLGFLTGTGGQVVIDQAVESAVSGEEKLPPDKWETPSLRGSPVAGILTPDELRQTHRENFVLGLDSYADGRTAPGSMGRTIILKEKDDRLGPYRHKTGKRGELQPTASGVYLGRAGELLENYASISNPVDAPEDFMRPQAMGNYQRVPDGVHGNEMVMAMLDATLLQEIKDHAKDGDFRLREMTAGEETVRHPLEGLMMRSNVALFQLLETKRSSDEALYCTTCGTERRIHNARATFYGEKISNGPPDGAYGTPGGGGGGDDSGGGNLQGAGMEGGAAAAPGGGGGAGLQGNPLGGEGGVRIPDEYGSGKRGICIGEGCPPPEQPKKKGAGRNRWEDILK